MKTGIQLITEERERQISKEGWTPEHDDSHDDEAMLSAAACYMNAGAQYEHNLGGVTWPWRQEDWKPSDQIRNLTKAAALLAAEIDRLQRLPATGEVR